MLPEHCAESAAIGFDPWLHVIGDVENWRAALDDHGYRFSPLPSLFDRIWQDRPIPPDAPFTLYPDDLAGESSAAKRARLAEGQREQDVSAVILTQLDSRVCPNISEP